MVGTYLVSHCSLVQVLQMLAQTLEFDLILMVVLKKTQVPLIQLLDLLQLIMQAAATPLRVVILLRAIGFIPMVRFLHSIPHLQGISMCIEADLEQSLDYYLLIDDCLQLRRFQGIILSIVAVSLQYNQNSRTHCIFSCLASYLRLAICLMLLQQ